MDNDIGYEFSCNELIDIAEIVISFIGKCRVRISEMDGRADAWSMAGYVSFDYFIKLMYEKKWLWIKEV